VADKQPASAEASTAKPAKNNEAATATAKAIDISKMEEVVLMPRLSDTMTKVWSLPGIRMLVTK
jgi:pyruvate dehydrogenase E2 component (dihydrolipoamide acetyltransferase)